MLAVETKVNSLQAVQCARSTAKFIACSSHVTAGNCVDYANSLAFQ